MTLSSAEKIAKDARTAFEESQLIDPLVRDAALEAIREVLSSSRDEVLAANQKDMDVGTLLSLILYQPRLYATGPTLTYISFESPGSKTLSGSR